jgi:hypothetical protein
MSEAHHTDAPAWVHDGIERVEQNQSRNTAIPGRYPATYAYDYLKTHADVFGSPATMSRADTATWLREQFGIAHDEHPPILRNTLKVLADAYLREHGGHLDEETKNAAIAAYPRTPPGGDA